jgi:hypothetical protein
MKTEGLLCWALIQAHAQLMASRTRPEDCSHDPPSVHEARRSLKRLKVRFDLSGLGLSLIGSIFVIDFRPAP